MFSSLSEKPVIDNHFEATVCWMSQRSTLKPGTMMRIKHTTHVAKALIDGIEFKVDVNNLSEINVSHELATNEIGQLSIKTPKPVIFDRYDDNRATGSFILIDESTNETVGAGMIGRPGCFSDFSS